ncbi:MAG: hypothetical protein H7343_12375 [Undibacterium sp.]|nr:hypothetical protein [Opitutaceae bacterium]
MKSLRLVFSLCAIAACSLQAQEERQAPPTEIPDFSNLDEYIYVPKSTLQFGFRNLSGPKTSFSGKGNLLASENVGTATNANETRLYHDGSVTADARTTAVDNGDGTSTTIPVPNDGKTNTWAYGSDKQLVDGYMTFHTYLAAITDSTIRSQNAGRTSGVELAVAYDMGKVFKRFDWSIVAGVGINDIASSMNGGVKANLTTVTDTYSLYGRLPPAAPYSAPSSTTTTVTNSDGTTSSDTADTTTLLGNKPVDRSRTVTTDSTSVRNRWKLKGAYFTTRAGPALTMQFTSRLKASVSAGLAVVYAGSTYSVDEAFLPDTGSEIKDSVKDDTSKFLVGYYADATLQFDATERTGFYIGAVYQATGSYDQTIASTNANYSTKIDLNNLNGLRAGMTFRF